ncbi:hypothetical protein EK599_10105 [Vibrio sp. T187]|uniref:hypothetical protein n=1 Tax=Vibrio TaxID=662 RepID=UPI0010CA04CE|nr:MULTISPECIES: hypothetical protein [Vibrio]MBW3696051.1 hypothetical protein [Vibrio sp. T187]
MLNTISTSPLTLPLNTIKKAFSVLIVASCLSVPSVSAKLTNDNWFPRSDLMLPRQMSTSVLNNGFRYVLMPTEQSGIEIRLDSGAKLTAFNASPESETELFQTLALLSDELKREANLTEMESSSLVIVGDINVSKVKREVLKQFSTSEFIDLDRAAQVSNLEKSIDVVSVAQQVEALPEVISISVLSTQDTEDSKKARREKLTRDIARSVLAERLNKAFESNQLMVSEVNTSESELFDHQLLTSTTVTMASEQDVEAGFKVLKQTLTNLVSMGVSRQEFEAHVTKLRVQMVENQPSIEQQAQDIVEAIQHHKVYLQPSDEVMLFDFHIAHMNDKDVTSALQSVWNESNGVRVTKGGTKLGETGLDVSAVR